MISKKYNSTFSHDSYENDFIIQLKMILTLLYVNFQHNYHVKFLLQPPNGFHGMMCSQKNPVSMGYTAEIFPFPSPISSHTSSPTNMADFNGTLFDDIDRINPTLPPMPPFILDQQLDHVGLRQQQHVCMNEYIDLHA